MSASKVKVGYLGPDNCTFGFQAFTQAFSPEAGICHERPNPSPFSSHHDICDAVGRLDVRYGVVAVENAIDGVVAETIRSIESVSNHLGLFVCGEVTVPIKLFYMNKSGEDKTPKRLLSHPTALGQCRRFVAELQKKGVSVRPSLPGPQNNAENKLVFASKENRQTEPNPANRKNGRKPNLCQTESGTKRQRYHNREKKEKGKKKEGKTKRGKDRKKER